MKITVFSAQPYDKKYFLAANNNFGHQLIFHETRLEPSTVELARGSDAVCAFVNDDLSEITIEALKAIDIPIIALRCAGFNNVDIISFHCPLTPDTFHLINEDTLATV